MYSTCTCIPESSKKSQSFFYFYIFVSVDISLRHNLHHTGCPPTSHAPTSGSHSQTATVDTTKLTFHGTSCTCVNSAPWVPITFLFVPLDTSLWILLWMAVLATCILRLVYLLRPPLRWSPSASCVQSPCSHDDWSVRQQCQSCHNYGTYHCAGLLQLPLSTLHYSDDGNACTLLTTCIRAELFNASFLSF